MSRLVLAPHLVEFLLQSRVVAAVHVGVRIVRVVRALHLGDVVVGIARGVQSRRGGVLHGVETTLGLDAGEGEEIHLARAHGALLVLALETESDAHAFLRLDFRLFLLVAASPRVDTPLQLRHLPQKLLVLVLGTTFGILVGT